MTLVELLHLLDEPTFILPSVLCCIAEEYPWFGARELKKKLQARSTCARLPLGEEQCGYEQMLGTAFLGHTQIYITPWLGDLKDDVVKTFGAFCTTYKGPHYLIVWAKEKQGAWFSKGGVVQMVEGAGALSTSQLATLPALQETSRRAFAQALLARYKNLSYEQLATCLAYAPLLGRSYDVFLETWAPKILNQKRSLYTLSGLFFGPSYKAFLTEWQAQSADYPPEFWTVYWSDLAWQAYVYRVCMQTGREADAKVAARRLPFAFVQREWRSREPAQCAQLVTAFSAVDHTLKNGGTALGLEVAFLNWFSGRGK
jgi:hypothetical protein